MKIIVQLDNETDNVGAGEPAPERGTEGSWYRAQEGKGKLTIECASEAIAAGGSVANASACAERIALGVSVSPWRLRRGHS